MVLRYRSFGHSQSDVGQYLRNIWKTSNQYTISDGNSMMKLVGHPITWLFDRCNDQFEIARFLAKVDFRCIYTCMLEIKKKKKHVRWIQL